MRGFIDTVFWYMGLMASIGFIFLLLAFCYLWIEDKLKFLSDFNSEDIIRLNRLKKEIERRIEVEKAKWGAGVK